MEKEILKNEILEKEILKNEILKNGILKSVGQISAKERSTEPQKERLFGNL